MPAFKEDLFDLPQFGVHPFGCWPSIYQKLSGFARLAAYMREAQKIERFRFALAAFRSSLSRIATEFDQASFVGVEFQIELLESCPQFIGKSYGVFFVLESHHEIIRIAHDNDIASRFMLSPVVGPQIKGVMQIDIRQ